MNYPLIEGLNGVLSVILLWMFGFGLGHLHREYRLYRSCGYGIIGCLKKLYTQNKPEIALITIFGAFTVRTFSLWYIRFINNHHLTTWQVVYDYDDIVLITTTGIMIIGVACWIRVISLFSGAKAFALWILMVASAVLFGLGSVSYPY